jgi:hypothetical protein
LKFKEREILNVHVAVHFKTSHPQACLEITRKGLNSPGNLTSTEIDTPTAKWLYRYTLVKDLCVIIFTLP